jgi:hypothetical protein
MAPSPQRPPLVNHPPITPPCQDPIFGTIIPVGYICEVATPGGNGCAARAGRGGEWRGCCKQGCNWYPTRRSSHLHWKPCQANSHLDQLEQLERASRVHLFLPRPSAHSVCGARRMKPRGRQPDRWHQWRGSRTQRLSAHASEAARGAATACGWLCVSH